MLRVLKVTLIIYGIIMVSMGLAMVVAPDVLVASWGLAGLTGVYRWVMAAVGSIYIPAGVGVLNAGRDPFGCMGWIKFAISKAILPLVVSLYAVLAEYVSLGQIVTAVSVDAIAAVVLLIAYPWRAPRENES